MSRFARKVDRGQDTMVESLRARGAMVEPKLARVGEGVPDLLVGYRGTLAVFEGKPSPDEAAAWERRLTKAETDWHRDWAGYPVFKVDGTGQALEVLDAFDACGHWPRLYRSHP